MGKTDNQTPEDLRLLQQRVEQWRQTRKCRGPMPEELWQDAVQLAEKYSMTKVIGLLGVGYSALKKRMGDQSQKKTVKNTVRFVECRPKKRDSLVDDLKSPETGACCIEFADPSGYSLKVQIQMSKRENLGVYLRQVWDLRECCK